MKRRPIVHRARTDDAPVWRMNGHGKVHWNYPTLVGFLNVMRFPPSLRWSIPLMLLGFGLVFVVTEYLALLETGLERAQSSVGTLALAQAARLAGVASRGSR